LNGSPFPFNSVIFVWKVSRKPDPMLDPRCSQSQVVQDALGWDHTHPCFLGLGWCQQTGCHHQCQLSALAGMG
jgi:hypothetical protein